MYSYIKGRLEEIREDHVTIENNGIGYRLYMPARCIQELPPRGEEVKIFTYLHVREDAMLLFGFASRDELELFRMLIGVSGIGPKGGLAILSVLSPDDLRFAVLSEDDKRIAKAPGIGKKTAQRLIIELKDKIDISEEDLVAGTGLYMSEAATTARDEAIQALEALGYSKSDAYAVVSKLSIGEEDDVETILKQALKELAFL
ncbi:MAG: Holliday junction branch migration protein RuvA [Lachnospiraceae bacterium]|nr:Holliday junction branch migration protein RuvA [Lachnospiraceae bacterium]